MTSSSSSSSTYSSDLYVYRSNKGYCEGSAVTDAERIQADKLLIKLKNSLAVREAIQTAASPGAVIAHFEKGYIDVYSRLGGKTIGLTYTTETGETIDLNHEQLKEIIVEKNSKKSALKVAKKILKLFSPRSDHGDRTPRRQRTPVPSRPGDNAVPINSHNHNGDQHNVQGLLNRIAQLEQERDERDTQWRDAFQDLSRRIGNSPAMQTVPPEFYERFLKQQEEISETLRVIQRLLENLGSRSSGSSSSPGASGDDIGQIQQQLGVIGEQLREFRINGPLQLKKIEQLEKELAEAKALIATLKSENSTLRQDNERLSKLVETLKTQLATAKQTIGTITAENDRLNLENKKIPMFESTIEDLRRQLSKLQSQIDQLSPLAAEIQDLRNGNAALITQNEALQSATAELGISYREEIDSLNATIKELRTALATATIQNATDAETIARLIAENKQLREQLAKNEELLRPLEEENPVLKSENEHLRKKIKENEEKILVNTTALEQNKNEINRLKQEILKFQVELETANNRIKSLTEEIATLNAKILALQKPILKSTALSTENESLKRNQEELNKRLEASEDERERLRLENGRLVNDLIIARREISAQKALIEKLQAELLVVKKNSDEQNRAKISKLKEQIASLEAENRRLTEAGGAKDAQIHKLEQNQKQIAALQAEIQRLKLAHSEELARIHAEYETKIAVFNEKAKEAESKNTELLEQVEKLQAELELLRNQKPRSSSESREPVSATIPIESYNLAQEQHEIEMTAKQEELSDLLSKYQELEQTDEALLEDIKRKESEIVGLKKSITALQNQPSKDAEIERLLNEIEKLKTKIQENNQKIEIQDKNEGNLRSRINTLKQQHETEVEDLKKQIREALKEKKLSDLLTSKIIARNSKLDLEIFEKKERLDAVEIQLNNLQLIYEELLASQSKVGRDAERDRLKALEKTEASVEIAKQLDSLQHELNAALNKLNAEKLQSQKQMEVAQEAIEQANARIVVLEQKLTKSGHRRTKSLTDIRGSIR